MLCWIKLDFACKLPTLKLTYFKAPNNTPYLAKCDQEVPFIPKVSEVTGLFRHI